MDRVTQGLLNLVNEMCESGDMGEKAFGLYLKQHIRFVKPEDIIPVLRDVSNDMEAACSEFDRKWLHLCYDENGNEIGDEQPASV